MLYIYMVHKGGALHIFIAFKHTEEIAKNHERDKERERERERGGGISIPIVSLPFPI